MQNKPKVKIGKMNISIAGINDYGKNNEQSTTNVTQNKAKVKIGKMNVSVEGINNYENEQPTTNVIQNKPKQSQFSNRKTDDRMRADLVCGDFGCTLV
jgi:hypothetical protein